jgi:hypothetical protein
LFLAAVFAFYRQHGLLLYLQLQECQVQAAKLAVRMKAAAASAKKGKDAQRRRSQQIADLTQQEAAAKCVPAVPFVSLRQAAELYQRCLASWALHIEYIQPTLSM